MKKLLLALGTVAAVAAPVASVIACGSSSSFSTVTDADKKAALESLSTKIQAKLTSLVSGTLDTTELNGNTVRFTYVVAPAPADESSDSAGAEGTRLTVDLDKGEITKLEVKSAGVYNDITTVSATKTALDAANIALKADFDTAKEAITPTAPTATTPDPVAQAKDLDVKEVNITDAPTTSELKDGVITISKQIDSKDFESSVSSKIAQEIGLTINPNGNATDEQLNDSLKSIKSIVVFIQDATATTKVATATVEVSSTTNPANGINNAINQVSKAIAESKILPNDQAASNADYIKDMISRIKAVDTTGNELTAADNLLKAVGNGTSFTDKTSTQSALGFKIVWNTKYPNVTTKSLLNSILATSGTYDASIVKAFNDQVAKFS